MRGDQRARRPQPSCCHRETSIPLLGYGSRDSTEPTRRSRPGSQRRRGARLADLFPPVIGLSVLVGFLVTGLFPYSPGWRLAALVVALALWEATGWFIIRLRAVRGIRGLRGRSRASGVTLLVCAVGLIPGVLADDPGMRWPYVGLGVAGGLAMWWVTQRQVSVA